MAFDAAYAGLYDAFYADKDYEGECRYIDQLIKKHAPSSKTLLDIGSGTGNHSLRLAKLGYGVTGLEPSPGMRGKAGEKAKAAGVTVEFVAQNANTMSLGRRFDVIICMFNVLDYIVVGQTLAGFFRSVREHLIDGGLFIFDFRNTAPCITEFSPVRNSWASLDGRKIFRVSETTVDAAACEMTTVYTCMVFEGSHVVEEFQDSHKIRFLAPREVQDALHDAGLTMVAMGDFLEIERPATGTTWNVMAVARR